ncbi:MAG TPA: hypothetical protein VFQ00_13805 [Terriglobales bacterium]|nr:hypothetical protein [Terriglobales bacterium]
METRRSGVLILRHTTEKEKEARDIFRKELATLVAESGTLEDVTALTEHVREAMLIEMAFSQILAELKRAEISSLSPAEQVWAVLDRAVTEYTILSDRAFRPPAKKDDIICLDALGPTLTTESGQEFRVDAASNSIASFLCNTILMLAYQNCWLGGERLVLPARVPSDDERQFKAGTHAYFATAWDLLLESSERLRFYGGCLQPIKEETATENSYILGFELELDSEMYISIARLRQRQLQLQWAFEERRLLPEAVFTDSRENQVSLPPLGYVSMDELLTVMLLDGVHHYPVESDELFGGLSLLEWLRGYAVMKRSFCPKLPLKAGEGLLKIEESALSKALQNGGLSALKAEVFIKSTVFGRNKKDLWDAPLLQAEDGLYLIGAVFSSADLLQVVISQISSLGIQVRAKGNRFEKEVLDLFTSSGIKARTFEYEIEGTKYQCDVAVIWDGILFVFECKNYLLPSASAAQEYYFVESMKEAADQANRVRGHLNSNPEIVRRHFGENASYRTAYAVVLNAMPFCRSADSEGVFFYHFSALCRFLRSGDVSINQPGIQERAGFRIQHKIHKLWRGSRPCADDLIAQLSDPIQLLIERGLWSKKRRGVRISERLAIGAEYLDREDISISHMLSKFGWSRKEIGLFETLFRDLHDDS